MELGLRGKRALVTGASKGIGRAIADALAADGAEVTICARGTVALDAAAATLRAHGVSVVAVAADLTTDAGVETVWQAHQKTLGPVDILVNNVTGPAGGIDILSTSDEEWLGSYTMNVLGQGVLTTCVCPGLTRTEAATASALRRTGRTNDDPRRVFDEFFAARRPLPAGRVGEPEDTAALVAFLCSERAGWLTGACIDVDGGWVKSIL